MARTRAVTKHRENPFMADFRPTTRKKRTAISADRSIVNNKTGEVEDVAEICRVTQVDDEKFLKLFIRGVKAFFDLKPTTYRMVGALLNEVQKSINTDVVYLNLETAAQYFEHTQQPPIKKTAFHSAINEMIEKGIIAQTTNTNQYYINPAIFFNGDRVRFVQEYRRTRSAGKQIEDQSESQPESVEPDTQNDWLPLAAILGNQEIES